MVIDQNRDEEDQSKDTATGKSDFNDHDTGISPKRIAIRLLYTVLFLFILGFVIIIIKLGVLFQFIYLFSARKPNESVRQFSNKLSTYAYRLLRYITLNENAKPFPFNDLPPEMEPSEDSVFFK